MAFPFEHYLLAFGGPLGTNEQWSCSLRISAAFGTDPTPGAELDALEALRVAVGARWVGANPISGDARLGWLKYNRIGTNGRYLRDTTNQYDYSPPVQGPAAGVYPLQIALVATLTTSVERGLANRGRIYLPSPQYPVTAGNRTISGPNAQLAANWVAALISDINAVPNVGNVVVASAVRAGAQRTVTSVNVGTVLDTMRSRRTSLTESRQVAAVTLSGVGGDF